MTQLIFQYCPKITVFSRDGSSVLLCRRKDEADYDGTFSLIGGKMEHSDISIEEALRREKTEEVGDAFKVRILLHFTVNVLFVKADGNHMILPHHYARHVAGVPVLNEEYSEAAWVSLDELPEFGPKIENIAWIAPMLKRLDGAVGDDDYVLI
ncbi:NUDIX hydrolase [Nonomuraea sp. NPDC049684]|uniref:NUDIX hydrolase n=1 Tax=Nonomuraea sp. NPDC049684 TaxID=3364356 RepID=UPI00379E888E